MINYKKELNDDSLADIAIDPDILAKELAVDFEVDRIVVRLERGGVVVLVATTALGMGYDKPDLSFVTALALTLGLAFELDSVFAFGIGFELDLTLRVVLALAFGFELDFAFDFGFS